METWIISVIAPIAIAVVSWILGKNGRQIEETAKLVNMLQKEIERLNERQVKMETTLENKEGVIERKNYVIQAAYECRTPSNKCPVLIANSKGFLFNNQNKTNDNEQRPAEQQPGQHPSEQDGI